MAVERDRDLFSGSLRDEPESPELDHYLPDMAAALRRDLMDLHPDIQSRLNAMHSRICPPCIERADTNVAFLASLDDRDLARYFGRWLRERGLTRWLWDLYMRGDPPAGCENWRETAE